jgi:ATP-dependent exoDNAse (exonuclease V) alpha subunit
MNARRARSPFGSARQDSGGQVTLVAEQRDAVAGIDHAIARRTAFALHGLAGTRKTTVATAKAASVLREKTGADASTIHSAFYHFVRQDDDEAAGAQTRRQLVFRPKYGPGELHGEVALLDECSMIGSQMARDIMATGITVVVIGDPGQLPPINGDPFFTCASFQLNEIHRQALESPIIRQAHAVRAGGLYTADGDEVRVSSSLTAADLRAADIVLAGRRTTRMEMNAKVDPRSHLTFAEIRGAARLLAEFEEARPRQWGDLLRLPRL